MTPLDPYIDPASEARDDHNFVEPGYCPDPSYESREPKVRLSPALITDMDPPPKGFQYWGPDKLDYEVEGPATSDIIHWYDSGQPGGTWLQDGTAYWGSCSGPWALRIGSDIWKKNCLSDPKEPETVAPTAPAEGTPEIDEPIPLSIDQLRTSTHGYGAMERFSMALDHACAERAEKLTLLAAIRTLRDAKGRFNTMTAYNNLISLIQ